MANKYSEELFGAIDTIIDKRLQALNKDRTVLCDIQDNTDAENGKYIVSNAGLRFDAYSENADYSIGERVWVLIPEGDFENTKMIIGKYVSAENYINYKWSDPLSRFVDITGNLCEKLNIDENGKSKTYGLIANSDKVFRIDFGDILAEYKQNHSLVGLTDIGISGDFTTNLTDAVAGTFGLYFTGRTDKEIVRADNTIGFYEFNFDFTSNSMHGSPLTLNGTYITQKLDYLIDPDVNGNITELYMTFEHKGDFLNKEGLYPVADISNLFLKNLDIRLGFNNITSTTAILTTRSTDWYNTLVTVDSNTEKILNFRFVYFDGIEYKNINSYQDLVDIRNQNEYGYPKVYLYRYSNSIDDSNYIDLRCSPRWHEEEGWNPASYDNEDFKNFQAKVTMKASGQEMFKSALVTRKSNTDYTGGGITELETLYKVLNNTTEGFNLDQRDAIELLFKARFSPDQLGTENENRGNRGFLKYIKDNRVNYPEYYNEDWYDGSIQPPTQQEILTAYCGLIIDKAANEDLTLDGENIADFSDFLIRDKNENGNNIYHAYSSYEIDPYKHFYQIRKEFENVYLSDSLIFINKGDTENNLYNLILGLQLRATDSQNGTYILYKATENANSELIRSSDAYVKRYIEAQFTSVNTSIEGLDSAERIYWLIPKVRTMIKDPVEGTSFGNGIYKPVTYSYNEFYQWKTTRDWSEYSSTGSSDGKDLYTNVSNVYKSIDEDTANNILNNWSNDKYYIKTVEKMIVKTQGEIPGGNNPNYKVLSENELSTEEYSYLSSALSNYYISMEDKTDTEDLASSKTIKASLAYQIKSTYRKNLTNNKIIALVARNNDIYTASIDLFFGVKGVNGTDYTLTIDPFYEEYYGENNTIIVNNNAPNVWTDTGLPTSNGSTKCLKIKATLFNGNDEVVDLNRSGTNYEVNFSLIPNESDHQIFKITTDSDRTKQIIERINNNVNIKTDNTGKYLGAIIKCEVINVNLGLNIVQYFILATRSNRMLAFIEGADMVVYDVNGVNPDYSKAAYAIKREDESNIELAGTSPITLMLSGARPTDVAFLPKIDNNSYLVPALGYTSGVKYNFYIRIKTNDDNVWNQPVLVILNKYSNTTATEIKTNKKVTTIGDNTTNSTISSIMSVTQKNSTTNEITGIVIGSLPSSDAQSTDSRAGILGYLNDNESYGFLNDGKCFLGTDKGIYIDNGGLVKVKWNTIDGTPTVHWNNITNKPTEFTPESHNHTINAIYWGGNTNSNVSANMVFAGPNGGSSATPSFRKLVPNDFSNFSTAVTDVLKNTSIAQIKINDIVYNIGVENTGTILNPIYSLVLTR